MRVREISAYAKDSSSSTIEVPIINQRTRCLHINICGKRQSYGQYLSIITRNLVNISLCCEVTKSVPFSECHHTSVQAFLSPEWRKCSDLSYVK